MKTPAVDIAVEFESVEPLFKMLGSFFYFWPLTTSRNYQTGGLRDFEFVGMDRFNSTVGFSFDYYSNRMRVDGSLQKIPFEFLTSFAEDPFRISLLQKIPFTLLRRPSAAFFKFLNL
jgi:hypothetical protein